MTRTVDIRGLQPELVRVTREFQALGETEETAFGEVWAALDAVWQNQFIDTLDETGCGRWEQLLGMQCRLTDTVAERRFRIRARLNEELPFTLRALVQALTALCGAGQFEYELLREEYCLRIGLELTVQRLYEEVEALAGRMVPANLVVEVYLRYRQWRDVEAFSWQAAGAATWQELRKGALGNE